MSTIDTSLQENLINYSDKKIINKYIRRITLLENGINVVVNDCIDTAMDMVKEIYCNSSNFDDTFITNANNTFNKLLSYE